MHLDVQTLSVVTVFITALPWALLVFAGLQNRSIRAPMWWGAAHIVNAAGLGLLTSAGAATNFITLGIGNALVLLGYGLTWSGTRIFGGRDAHPLMIVLAPAIWIGAVPAAEFRQRGESPDLRRFDHDVGAGAAHGRGVFARP